MSVAKINCAKCAKPFTKATLKKNDGVCGRCFNSSNANKPSKKTKQHISAQMKDAVWRKMGNVHETLCPICRVTTISSRNFACGHVIAESVGGKTEVGNLEPICTICNSSMGVKNMNEYKKELWAGRENEYKNEPTDIKVIDHKPSHKLDMLVYNHKPSRRLDMVWRAVRTKKLDDYL